MLWGPAQTVSFDTQLVFNTMGSVLPCKIVVCGFVFVGAWKPLGWQYVVLVQLYTLLGCTFYIMSPCSIVSAWKLLRGLYKAPIQLHRPLSCKFICAFILCPLLYCVSPVYNLAMISSVCWHSLIFLSSSCTHYFVPFHPYIYMCLL